MAAIENQKLGAVARKVRELPVHHKVDAYLQIQVPAIAKRQLGIRAAESREPIHVIVIRVLKRVA